MFVSYRVQPTLNSRRVTNLIFLSLGELLKRGKEERGGAEIQFDYSSTVGLCFTSSRISCLRLLFSAHISYMGKENI